MLPDLRESGSIEQDADIVVFLFRPEYYNLQPENGVPGSTEIIIAKHRNGSTGKTFLNFVNTFAQFKDIDSYSSFNIPDNSMSYSKNFQTQSGSYTLPSKMNNMDNIDEPDF